ncbi:MAG: SMP-30/gluconolactonase/LRE family protein [Bryobacterales bacterium]
MFPLSYRCLTFVAAFLFAVGCGDNGSVPEAQQQPTTIAPAEVLQLPTFSEGPVFDYDGNLFVSHGPHITKLTPAGMSSVWIELDGPNGHKVLPDGTHLVCEPKRHAVLHVAADGGILGNASSECSGEPLRAPNDLTLDLQGGFYFTDPGGSRDAPIGTVHYVDAEGVTHLAAGGLRVPNGLVLRQDGATLLVSETVPNRILEFPVIAPGELGPMRVFADLPSKEGVAAEPDGLALDSQGNLYVAHLNMAAVEVLDPQGKLLRSLPGGNYDVSNLVFGGPALSRLFITGSVGNRSDTAGRIYRLDLDGVRGVSSLLSRR